MIEGIAYTVIVIGAFAGGIKLGFWLHERMMARKVIEAIEAEITRQQNLPPPPPPYGIDIPDNVISLLNRTPKH